MFWLDGPNEIIPEERICMKEDENRYFVPGTIHGGDYLIQAYYWCNDNRPQGDRIGLKYLYPTDILEWELQSRDATGVFQEDVFEELINEKAEEYIVENDGSGDFASLVKHWENSHAWSYEEALHWAKEFLLHSLSYPARKLVAKAGYGLDKLIKDDCEEVRCEVARQKYGLDMLVKDRSSLVRIVVAETGYGLDKLIKDRHFRVRRTVAEMGYGLEELVNDPDYRVRSAALYELKKREPKRVVTKTVCVRCVGYYTDTITMPADLNTEQEFAYVKREMGDLRNKLDFEIDNYEIIEKEK